MSSPFISTITLGESLPLANWQSAARQLQAREAAQTTLGVAADHIADTLANLRASMTELAADEPLYRAILDGSAEPLAATPHSLWWSDGQSVDSITTIHFAVPDPDVLVFLRENSRAPLRIVTTNDGVDVILLKQRAPTDESTRAEWIGASLGVTDLIAAAELSGLITSGMNVALVDDSGTPVYWTAPAAPTEPVTSAVRLGEARWELRASPKGSWNDTDADWQTALLVAILASGCALTMWALAKKPQALREQINRLTTDLEAKDSDLSHLLRSRSQIENQLVTSLTVDLYTGLPNRASFVEHLQARLAKSRLAADGGVLLAVVLLHKLGEVGHSMGATVAEEVMREAGERLQQTAGTAAYLARTGESELALCFALSAVRDTAALTERLMRSLEARFTVGHRPVYVPAVMGIATSSDGYSHGPELLGQAALAANGAIIEGQRSALFRPEAKEERISLLQLEADLQVAIDGSQLRLFFQPIVSVTEGHVVGFESLIRWQHPTESWIGPDRFIPLAESMGQMARISDWVLHQGVAHSKQFAQLRAEPIYVTVNLTPRDLNRELCSRLFALLDSVRLPPQCIRIEITETAVVRDFRIAARLIAELNERGVRVLLDDFGTGYSSLSYLRDLPFHAVKIDRSFIHKMTTEARDFGLVKSIVGLVHYLGMECIAEGVETQEQLDLIGMMDCNYWQGFLFSRPLPASQIEPLLHDTRRKPGMTLVASS
jgi:predicted signal transduction protein with EAL and GGDEF domain